MFRESRITASRKSLIHLHFAWSHGYKFINYTNKAFGHWVGSHDGILHSAEKQLFDLDQAALDFTNNPNLAQTCVKPTHWLSLRLTKVNETTEEKHQTSPNIQGRNTHDENQQQNIPNSSGDIDVDACIAALAR